MKLLIFLRDNLVFWYNDDLNNINQADLVTGNSQVEVYNASGVQIGMFMATLTVDSHFVLPLLRGFWIEKSCCFPKEV